MKIGDTVVVTELVKGDEESGIQIGDIGVITGQDCKVGGCEIFRIKFEKELCNNSLNIKEDGTYLMLIYQLSEVI